MSGFSGPPWRVQRTTVFRTRVRGVVGSYLGGGDGQESSGSHLDDPSVQHADAREVHLHQMGGKLGTWRSRRSGKKRASESWYGFVSTSKVQKSLLWDTRHQATGRGVRVPWSRNEGIGFQTRNLLTSNSYTTLTRMGTRLNLQLRCTQC
jgi:hypothetical protein